METIHASRTSPSKALEDAEAPKEEAHGLELDIKVEKTMASSEIKSAEEKMSGSVREDDDGVLTGAMMEEEKVMHQQVEQEESEIKKKQDKLWGEMDQADRETRYKRLQFLLKKSNMYTQYLLQRMDAQEEEERKKRERKKKKEEKVKMKENLPVTASSTNTRSTDDDKTEPNKTPKEEESSPSQESTNKDLAQFNLFQPSKKKKSEPSTASCDIDTKSEVLDNLNDSVTEQDSSQEISKDSNQESEKMSDIEKPLLFTGGELRQYQLEGFSWLKTLYENGVNGILADEMGLGKTVQCIALISHIVNMRVVGPFLVCAPLSTLPNWYSEFRRFAPKVPVVLYHGTKDERDRKRVKIRRLVSVTPEVQVYPVVITSYEVTIRDRKVLQNFDWKYLIVDEGHRIKNTQCRLIKELRMYRNTHRLLLTGTPLQNNLSELWSLLNYLLPEIFDDLGSFETWLDVERISSSNAEEKIVKEEEEKNILSMLHQILTPFMLRRLKQDVDLVIPPKKEILVYAHLTELQQRTYKAVVDRTIFNNDEEEDKKENIEVNEKGKPVRRAAKKKIDYSLMGDSVETPDDIGRDDEELDGWIQAMAENTTNTNEKIEQKVKKTTGNRSLRNIMMQLRKCCNHPYLIDYPLDKYENFKVDENLVECCGKMKMLDRLLTELKKRGHRVLVFSQMTKMLDIIQDYCHLRKHEFCRLDGSFSLEDRQVSIEDFNKYEDVFLFLVSTRAGGLGINLTAADTVIIYDSDWNPQCDLQAQDRCHRIGQTKPVVVYRLVTANTIDQKIVERATAKRRLEKMVIHKGKFKHGIQKKFSETTKPLNPKDLLDLLQSKDHEMEIQSQNLSKKEIDILIDRSDLWEKFKNVSGKPENKSEKGKKKVSTEAKEIEGVFKVVE
ncbi:hypothetical protein FSP39_004956 [Pinctada imbricata]|uniref:Proliferation-associated SNF2-like protein n=1 Tax=Pinctada imbricata TaxID=66713 RepID=A0AA88XL11_PINIB|nr:hypothetical protein FSP39_004956 [Pinctada imbricata]